MKDYQDKKKASTVSLVTMGMFTGILVILSQFVIVLPAVGVPITLQTFAVALIGYILGWKKGGVVILIYILLGAVGIPVFAGFGGGLSTLLGKGGGFIFGFIFLSTLCGKGYMSKSRITVYGYSFLGLLICHLLGIIWYMVLTGLTFKGAFILVSTPFLVKDMISIVVAYIISKRVKKHL